MEEGNGEQEDIAYWEIRYRGGKHVQCFDDRWIEAVLRDESVYIQDIYVVISSTFSFLGSFPLDGSRVSIAVFHFSESRKPFLYLITR